MKRFRHIHWRITLAFIVLTVVLTSAMVLFLVIFIPGRFATTQEEQAATYVLRVVGVAVGVALAVASVLAFLIVGHITRSLRAITHGAQRMASGDLEYRVRAVTDDETQELAEALNQITGSLRRMVTDFSEEHNTMSTVLATMNDGVAVIDAEGRVALSNPAAHDLLGLRVAEQDGSRLVEMVRDHELHRVVADCRRTGQNQFTEVELTRSRRYLGAIATPLRLRDDGPVEVLLVVHDLTRAQQVETTRREFVANVSHELRNPLASIRAAAETLESGALDQKELAYQFLARILREVDRMCRLGDELLELSSLETGQALLHIGSISIASPVHQAADQYRPLAEAKDISLAVQIPPDLPLVIGDEDKLRQVLSNLLENGIKFTPEGGSLTVSVESKEEELAVAVADNGIGIPEQHLHHVFERFYKVDRSRQDGGTGLGLAIANHIVGAHKGHIWVDSREGEGSCFTFTVPIDKSK